MSHHRQRVFLSQWVPHEGQTWRVSRQCWTPDTGLHWADTAGAGLLSPGSGPKASPSGRLLESTLEGPEYGGMWAPLRFQPWHVNHVSEDWSTRDYITVRAHLTHVPPYSQKSQTTQNSAREEMLPGIATCLHRPLATTGLTSRSLQGESFHDLRAGGRANVDLEETGQAPRTASKKTYEEK